MIGFIIDDAGGGGEDEVGGGGGRGASIFDVTSPTLTFPPFLSVSPFELCPRSHPPNPPATHFLLQSALNEIN